MLQVTNLTVEFPGRTERVVAVHDVSLEVAGGTIHGLVGESGAGKSTIGAAILGMIPEPGYRAAGSIRLGDRQLESLTARQREVLQLAAEGLSNKGIARRLHLSPATVKNHMAAIIAALGARNRTDAIRIAIKWRLIAI